jgi:hypothetical protein
VALCSLLRKKAVRAKGKATRPQLQAPTQMLPSVSLALASENISARYEKVETPNTSEPFLSLQFLAKESQRRTHMEHSSQSVSLSALGKVPGHPTSSLCGQLQQLVSPQKRDLSHPAFHTPYSVCTLSCCASDAVGERSRPWAMI